MYSINIRYYSSEEGLLVWKHKEVFRTLEHAIAQIAFVLSRGHRKLGAVNYPDEKYPTFASVYGYRLADIYNVKRCNIQVRENGKLVPWKHLL